jgi:uncharacterized protein (TIGR00730 family)
MQLSGVKTQRMDKHLTDPALSGRAAIGGRAASQRSVCVFCGARPGTDPAYLDAATQLGNGIARAGWRLVFGAGDAGLMGAVAASAQSAGGASLGVIPTHLIPRERSLGGNGPLVVTETMHERKKVMAMNSDAFVVLPGGAGTLDEFFEVLTWRQLGLHNKPIVVVNTKGYWDPLLALVDRVITQGLADASLAGFLTPVADADAALNALSTAFARG